MESGRLARPVWSKERARLGERTGLADCRSASPGSRMVGGRSVRCPRPTNRRRILAAFRSNPPGTILEEPRCCSYPRKELRSAASRIFVAMGAPEDIAEHVATSLVESNLAGHDSHGVIRIPTYVARASRGLCRPAARPSAPRDRRRPASSAGTGASVRSPPPTRLTSRSEGAGARSAAPSASSSATTSAGSASTPSRGAMQGFVAMLDRSAGSLAARRRHSAAPDGRSARTRFAFGVPGQSEPADGRRLRDDDRRRGQVAGLASEARAGATRLDPRQGRPADD